MDATALDDLAEYALDEGRIDDGLWMLRQSIRMSTRLTRAVRIQENLLRFAYAFAAQKKPEVAASLLSFSTTRIEQTQSVAKRLDEISTQRLLAFEMINVLNNKRPAGMDFNSVTPKGSWQLDIRGQANSADATSTFETDARKIPGVDKLEVMEKNSRDRMTVFHYEITFKPGWLEAGGGK